MSAPESTDVLTCASCGQACVEVEGGRGWLHLEVTRELPVDDLHWWEVDFCSQEHAAEWFSRPLPSPIRGNGEAAPTTLGDRLAMAGCFTAFAGVLGLLGLGTWTAVRFVLDLF